MKSTKAEVLRRVNEVFKLRLGGAEFLDIREYADAPEQRWGVSDTQLRRYIAAADALCKERFDAKADHLLARHLLQRRQLYAHAMGAGDFRTALAVLRDEAELEALYPPKRTELTGKDGGALKTDNALVLSDEERAAAVANLLARVGLPRPGPDRNGEPDPAGPAVGGPRPGAEGGRDGAGPLADGADPLFR